MILYPEYRGEPNTWKPVKLPPIPEKLLKQLASVGQIAGVPRFRIVDGSRSTFFHEGDAELPRGNYLQYAQMLNVPFQDGWQYFNGKDYTKVSDIKDVPSGKVAISNYIYRDYGAPRYMVEVFRDAREAGIEESGYVWAWTVDLRETTVVNGEAAEISYFRMPTEFDVQHAKEMLRIIEMSTEATRKASAQKFMEQREARAAEQKEIRRESQAESVERLVRDIQ